MTQYLSFKKILLVTLAIGFIALMYFWYLSCWGNYSDTLKTLGKPMQENVLAFFKENQRYPTQKESILLLRKSGCLNIRKIEGDYNFVSTVETPDDVLARTTGYYCTYNSTVITVAVTIANLSQKSNPFKPYDFMLKKHRSRCIVTFKKNGTVKGKGSDSCWQDFCMKPWNA